MEGEVSFLQTRSAQKINNPIPVSLYFYRTVSVFVLLTMLFVAELRAGWEVPSIAHYCEIFRKPFRLPDFDIDVSIICTLKLTDTTKLCLVYIIPQIMFKWFVDFCRIQTIPG